MAHRRHCEVDDNVLSLVNILGKECCLLRLDSVVDRATRILSAPSNGLRAIA